MVSISEPQVTVNIIGANSVVPNADQRILIVGQKLAAGTAPALTLLQDLPLNQEDNLFGAGSMVGSMSRVAQSLNQITPIDVIPLDDDGSGVDATGVVTVTGGYGGGSGDIIIVVGGRGYTVTPSTTVASPTQIGDAFVTAITADTGAYITAVNAAGVLTLTAKNAGTLGNFLTISTDDLGGELGVTLPVTTGFNGGGVDPDLSAVLALIGDTRYQTIIWPYGSQPDIDVLADFLNDRFNEDNKVLDGIGITGLVAVSASVPGVAGVINSQNIVMMVDDPVLETNYAGPAVEGYFPDRFSSVGAIRALRLTDGASIAQFVISSFGANDSFGGPALASKPYFNTPLPGVTVQGINRGYSQVEIESINDNGGTVIGNNPSKTGIILGQALTTYQTDSASNPDVSFKFLNYVDTASNAREYFFNNLKSRFAQSRLTTGDVIAGRDQANAETIAAYVEKLYQDLSGPDFVLVEAGETAIKFFKDNLTVVIDTSQGLATITMIVPIVTQLREILATMQISFGTEG